MSGDLRCDNRFHIAWRFPFQRSIPTARNNTPDALTFSAGLLCRGSRFSRRHWIANATRQRRARGTSPRNICVAVFTEFERGLLSERTISAAERRRNCPKVMTRIDAFEDTRAAQP
jgi:hypothetical protein